jgi:lipopolysaccharide export LptBFGC system permease protein LptF
MITAACLITGGACWILRWALPRFDLATADPLGVAGAVLISLGVAGIGARLVRSGMLPLRLLVSIASVLLVLSLLEVLHSVGDEIVIDAILGVFAFVVAALTVGGESAPKEHPSRHRLAR